MSNKLETAMWLSRLFTVYCSIMFILPILGWVFLSDIIDTLLFIFFSLFSKLENLLNI